MYTEKLPASAAVSAISNTSTPSYFNSGLLVGYQAVLSVTASAMMMLFTLIAARSANNVVHRDMVQGEPWRATKTLLSPGFRAGIVVLGTKFRERRMRARRVVGEAIVI